ncbi:hypothetical protein MLD38_016105 [Melastoma candidum]|uniref:Uncharacterized protein n=1 Tax=Melastoma candidum TaxID=119954 RepID=A0ACB9RIH6_9MYRT|nr:hypothetical protein MLD38_016105 [Melastoma candidum]
MGNAPSSPPDPQFAAASRAFTSKELGDLKLLFDSPASASRSGSDGQVVSLSGFQEHFGLSGPLSERLFDVITCRRKDRRLLFEDLVIAKATYEKGSQDEIEEFIYGLLDINGDGVVSRSDLESVLTTVFDNVFDSKYNDKGFGKHHDVLDLYLDSAQFSRTNDGNGEKIMSFEDMRNWFSLLPSVRKFLSSLLIPPGQGRPGSQVPRLLHWNNIDSNQIVLKDVHAWHIGGALSEHELDEWKLLYHSSFSGLSFSTFLGNITNIQGPTVLVIKDREGHIFGGYASQPWERHGDFYGDMKSFLFQLYPRASIFRPTGANRNIQWCAVNFSSEDIPNGIGFGGRANHFGLFLSASFDRGESFACTTFGSPCLSKASRFYPESIECWAVVQRNPTEKLDAAAKGTILERFKEDRNMLNMVGLANSSD